MKKSELQERNNYLEKENTILLQAVNDLANDKVEWIYNYRCDDERYQYGVSRLDGAAGGIFYTKFAKKGQNPHTDVAYLEDVILMTFGGGHLVSAYGLAEAVGIARTLRNQLLDKERKSR